MVMSSGIEDVHGPLFYIPPFARLERPPLHGSARSQPPLSVFCFILRVANVVSAARCGLLLTILSHHEKKSASLTKTQPGI